MHRSYSGCSGMPGRASSLWKVTQTRSCGPAYSLSKKRKKKDRTRGQTPGPNAYKLPDLMTSNKRAVKFGGARTKFGSIGGTLDMSIPGPNRYNPTKCKINYKSAPSISISKRPKSAPLERAKEAIPGPGKYSVRSDSFRGPSRYRRNPAYSLRPRVWGQKSMQATGHASPGPAAYILPTTMKYRGISLKGRTKALEADPTPAPNQYKLPNRSARPWSSRSCSIAAKWRKSGSDSSTPGPIYNTVRGMGYRGPSSSRSMI